MKPNIFTSEVPNQAESTFDPWIFWVTLRRWWWFATPVGIVLAGLTAVYLMKSFAPVYSASHLLEANQDFVVFENVLPTVKNLASAEKELILNAIVLDPVLAEPECRKAPSLSNPATAASNLKKNLWVQKGGTESRLLVGYKDTDPAAAAIVCNAVVESYLRQRNAFDNTRVSNLERWLEPEIQRWEQTVEERKRIVHQCSEQTLGYAPGGQLAQLKSKSNVDLAAALRAQMAELSLKISVDEARLAMKSIERKPQEAFHSPPTQDRRPSKFKPTEIEIEKLVSADDEVLEAKKLISRYKNAVLELEDQEREGIRRSEYNRNKQRIAYYQKVLKHALVSARVRAIENLRQVAEKLNHQELSLEQKQEEKSRLAQQQHRIKQLKQERLELDVYKTKLRLIQSQFQREKERLEQYGGATAELQFAQEELGVATDVLNKLRTRVAAIQTERRQDGAVRSLAPARTPQDPVEDFPFKKFVMLCGAAMTSPFLVGLIFELRAQRITSSSMCQEIGLSVVAEVTKLPTARDSGKGRRLFQESIDGLQASLSLRPQSASCRSIAIVSSMTGEGKSSIASQLAISIARATGEKVLLVDADLRCPEQHLIFGTSAQPRFSEVVLGTASLSDMADTYTGNSIHVLPSDPVDQNRRRVINDQTIKNLINEALKQYGYVIFDTAPVLSAGETLALASAVDTTLLCTMRDVSRVDNVKRAIEKLSAVGAKNVGVVFNGISAREYAARHGDYFVSDASIKLRRAA